MGTWYGSMESGESKTEFGATSFENVPAIGKNIGNLRRWGFGDALWVAARCPMWGHLSMRLRWTDAEAQAVPGLRWTDARHESPRCSRAPLDRRRRNRRCARDDLRYPCDHPKRRELALALAGRRLLSNPPRLIFTERPPLLPRLRYFSPPG